jgi:DNA-binding CsgD family transcriptional regulator
VISQSDSLNHYRTTFKGKMTNLDVVDAKILHHKGYIDQSLRKGFEILASNIQLSAIDSFHTYQILAYNLDALSNYPLALEYAEYAIHIVDRAFEKNEKFQNSKWIASYYIKVGRYQEAIDYKKQGIGISKDTLTILKLYNDIGFIYYQDNQLDSAIHYYKKIVEYDVDTERFSGIIGLAMGNIGAVYMFKKDYKTALRYLKIDAELNWNRDLTSYYNALNSQSECYYFLEDYKSSIKTLDGLKKFKSNDLKKIGSHSVLKTYKLYMDSYAKLNQSALSLEYMNKYFNLKDSISLDKLTYESLYKEVFNYKLSNIQKDLEVSNTKIELIEAKKQRVNFSTYLLIIFILLILVIIIAYFNRQRRNSQIQRLNTELMVLEIANKKKDLNNVASNLSFIRKFIDEALEKIKNIQKATPENIKSEIISLSHEFKRFKNSDENLAVLQTDFEKTNSQFFSELEKQFPELTQNERELCGMLLLKLSTKDIASFRNVTPNAVKKARQRLRKKLPLSEKESITKFLENLK